MTIVHVSYAFMSDQSDPERWLDKLDFYTGILEAQLTDATVKSVHCISSDGMVIRNGVEYHFLNASWLQKHFPFVVNRYVATLKPDVVVVHGLIYPMHILLLRTILKQTARIVAQHHAERPLTNLLRYVQPLADRYIDAYFFCSIGLGDQWVKSRLINDRAKIHEVMEASSQFRPISRDIARTKTNVSGERVFLWVGGLHDRKDPLLMVLAFSQFARKCKGVHLYMIYQTSALINQVTEAIKNEVVSESITLLGEVAHHDLVHWYNSADFIVATSKYEGSGVAVCEAMSCGCVPILTDIPSFEMMTNKGNIGFLFQPGDTEGLVTCLERSLQLDLVSEREKVLNNFSEHLSFEAIANKMMQVFRSVCK